MKRKNIKKITSKDLDEEIEVDEDELDEELEEEYFEDEEEEEDEEDEDLEDEDEIEEEDDDDEDLEDEDEDEEEDEDDEDLEDEDEEGDESLYRQGGEEKRSFLPIIIVGIIILSSIGAAFLYYLANNNDDPEDDDLIITDPFDGLGNDVASANLLRAAISEINPSEEWFEVYLTGAGTTEGWTFTSFDEGLIDIPTITGLQGSVHILIHTGNGSNELDGSDGKATAYLELPGDVLEDGGDEIALFDSEEDIIDFVAWGSGNGDTERDGWNETRYLDAPPTGKSLSLQGEDQGMSSYWTIGPSSPLGYSIIEIDLSPDDDHKAHIINGRSEPVKFEELSEDGKYINVNVTTGVPAGQPVNQTLLDQVSEYVNFTYNLLKENGFGDALASGTDGNGNPFINITVTSGGGYGGSCDSDGDIDVDLGTNKAANKQTVEHEMTHNFQFSKRADGTSHINPNKHNFIDEGQAEFWGRYSAMVNYNLTWSEIEEELDSAGSMNLYDYYHYSWYDIFTDWPGVYNRSYIGVGHYYTGSFLFMKFLMDKFNRSTLAKIHNAVINGPGTANDTVGIDAIEKATGKKFEDLLREFRLYMLENRFTQYKNDTKFRTSAIDNNHTFNGTTVSDTEMVEQFGSRINKYYLNGSWINIDFEPKTNRSRWQITIIKVKPDGSREYEEHTLEKGEDGKYIIFHGYDHVIIIKTRLNGSNYFNEYFNITISDVPIILPALPEMGFHLIEDPEDDPFFSWTIDNILKDMGVRIQIDNTSTFSDPFLDNLTWEMTHNRTLPQDLPNGTWWWRLRWELDDIYGPWAPYRNFTIWRGWERPEILWDPYPIRYENGSGSFLVVIPNTTVKILPYDVPDGICDDNMSAQFQIGDGEILDWDIDHTFDLGAYINRTLEWFKWRPNLLPFPEWPWFQEDLLWDPEPPTFDLFEPLNGSRHKDNVSLRIGASTLPNGDFAVDSFFDIYYSIDFGPEKAFDHVLETTMEPGVFEIDLNLSEMEEGMVIFNISLYDLYGRRSEPTFLHLEIDRTLPIFSFMTDPDTGHHFNVTPKLIVRSMDETIDRVHWLLVSEFGPEFENNVTEPITGAGYFDWVWDLNGYSIPEGAIFQQMTIFDDVGNFDIFYWEFILDLTPPEIEFILPLNDFDHITEEFLQIGVDLLLPDTQSTVDTHTARIVIRDMESGLEAYNGTMFWNGIYWEASIDTTVMGAGYYRLEAYAWDLSGNGGGDSITGTFSAL